MCDKLACQFFVLFVKAWTLSYWTETNLARIICSNPTTVNESLFHALAIIISKVYNVKEYEYIMRARACYIAFTKKQRRQQKINRILAFNKHAASMIAATQENIGVEEPHIIDALESIFTDDTDTQNKLVVSKKHSNRVRESRATAAGTYKESLESQGVRDLDLGLGDKPADFSTLTCMPCPPFPFLPESMLESEEQLSNFQAVQDFTKSLKVKQARRSFEIKQKQSEKVMDIVHLADDGDHS